MTFATHAQADKTMAVLNAHPALARTGINFCRPPEIFYPELSTLFTARVVEPHTPPAAYVPEKLEPEPAREPWMEAGWTAGVPSPSEVYAVSLNTGQCTTSRCACTTSADGRPRCSSSTQTTRRALSRHSRTSSCSAGAGKSYSPGLALTPATYSPAMRTLQPRRHWKT